ncbi:hypothetical protein ACLKA7_000420 [Drosophila subpalustris]
MDEEPHAHEQLVAKLRRSSSSGSEANAAGSEAQNPAKSSGREANATGIPAKSRRLTGSSSSGSEANMTGSNSQIPVVSNEEIPAAANLIAPKRSFLLEPMILILLFAYNFSSTVLKSQIIYQSCTTGFGYPNEVCKLLGTRNATNETKRIEAQVQPYAAQVFLTIKLVECIVPAFCGLFVGAWADRYGRKPLLMISYLGYGLQYLLSACIAYFTMQSGGQVSPWFYVLTIIPLSLFGSSVTYSVAALCYIGDVSTGKLRSYRMIAYELAIYVGLLLGSFASGFVYEATNGNAYIIFVISAASVFSALFTIGTLLPESLRTRQGNLVARQEFMLKDLWHTCTRRRDFTDRSVLILLMLVLLLTAFVSDGNNSVFYMFMRTKFHWTVKEFTSYETVSILVPAVAGSGGMFFLWSLRQCTNSSLIWLAMISLVSHASSSVMKAFAAVDWQIYVAIGLGVFKSLVNPMCRTMITNLLLPDERGKIFALISVLQTLSPFASSSLYILIYTLTLNTCPSLFNMISGDLFGFAIILLLLVRKKKCENAVHYDPVFK